MKVFSHNTEGGLFTDIADALSKNPDNPEKDLFSILNKLEDYRNQEGHFHFKLCYPELQGVNGGNCNEWTQSSNPVSQGTVSKFRPISIEFPKDGLERSWGGLGRSNWDETNALLDDTGTDSKWWSAIGAMKYHGNGTTFPGPFPNYVTRVELFIAIGNG